MSTPTAGYTIAGAPSVTTAPLPAQVAQADHAADYVPMYSSAAAGTVAINLANLLGTVSQTMGITDIQTVSNKVNDNSNTYAPRDTSFTLQNAASGTKRAQFLLSSITAGQTRIFTLPDYNGTMATQGGVETFTNKTLTAPIINNATISSDLYAGFSSANSGIIYGMSVTSGLLASAAILGKVNTAAVVNGAITPDKLSTGATSLMIATSENTSTTSFTDLTTPGPAVTVTIGANGAAFITIYAYHSNSLSGDESLMGFAVSGSTTTAANDNYATMFQAYSNNAEGRLGVTFLVTGLAPGTTTFTAKYRASAGSAGFKDRRIGVVPL